MMKEKIYNYLVGDIHGCYQEYLELEDKIDLHAKKNEAQAFIISTGDLVDRGPGSAKVLEHFFQGSQKNTHAAVLGNHEIMMIEALQHFSPDNFLQENCEYPKWLWTYKAKYKNKKGLARHLPWKDYVVTMKGLWLSQGGYQTLTSFGCKPDLTNSWQIEPNILSYLLNLPLYIERELFVVTHALAQASDLANIKKLAEKENFPNLSRGIGILREAANSLIWNRVPPISSPAGKTLISGHTPFEKAKRRKKINCIQIDTGCVFGGRLTAWCDQTDEFISVKALRKYT